MSNAKRLISVILAIVMICSTLVVGANAAYTEYKGSAIAGQYNGLDKPVLTTAQYASAAMDEVDRMLNKEQIHLTSDDLFGIGELDVTSVDATMDSVYALVNSGVFLSFGSLLGDLATLSADSFKPAKDGGIRRATAGKSDIDVIYQVLGFLYENKDIFVSYANQSINLGTILPSVVDLSDYTDVNKLLKSLLYDAVYDADAPDNIATYSIDDMAQTLIDQIVVKEIPELEGHTSVSTGSMYDFIDSALKVLYNTLLVDLLNGNVKYELNKFCGVTGMVTDKDYNILNDDEKDKSAMNDYAKLLNVDYTVEEYKFAKAATTGAKDPTLVSQFNDVLGSLLDEILSTEFRAKFTWKLGGNEYLLDNLVAVAKVVVTDETLSDALFQPYNVRYTDAEINAMTPERLITYLLCIMINNSADEIWVPETVTTLREFGFYCLQQLLATAAPSLDFSSMDKNSTDTLVIMGIDFAIYNINAVLDMGLSYVYTMDGVDAQLNKAAKYGVDNYGGLLNGITISNKDGWKAFDDIIFSIFDKTWLPTSCSSATYCFKTLLIDTLIDGILDLDVAGMLGKLENNHSGGLNDSPKKVILDLAVRIINIIFPEAISTTATTFDAIATNDALANTIDKIFSTLYNKRSNLVKAILPTLCEVLELTNEQEFKFPSYTYEDRVVFPSAVSYYIPMRNQSTGINTGYTYYADENKDGTPEKCFKQDALYTYEITGITVTSSNDKLLYNTAVVFNTTGDDNGDWKATTNPNLAGGETGYLHLTGTVKSTGGVARVAVTYKVLTEDGTTLTKDPITDYLYVYVSTSASQDTIEKEVSVASGNYTFIYNANDFCSSMRDLTRIEVTVVNNTTSDIVVDPSVASTDNLQKLIDTGYVEFTTGNVAKAGFLDSGKKMHATKTTFYLLKTTAAYDSLPTEAPEEDPTAKTKADVWKELVESTTLGYKINATTSLPISYPKLGSIALNFDVGPDEDSQTSYTMESTNTAAIFLYNEMSLASTVSSELNKHRQASNYKCTNEDDEWVSYMTALDAAAAAVKEPYVATSFQLYASGKSGKIAKAAPALEAAIKALDACEQGGGFTTILKIIDGINPDNVDANGEKLSYDDPTYKFFGVADYEPYTYYNYKDEYRAAMRAYESTLEPDEDGNYTIVSALKVAELEHRLKLYADRLIPKAVEKQHLQARYNAAQTITSPENEAKYTAESWAAYVKAYNFANAVLTTADESLNQTKINKAYEALIEYEKCLVPDDGEEPGTDTPVYNPVDPESKEPLTVLKTTKDENVLGGMEPGVDPTKLFETTACTVECLKDGVAFASGDKIATGDVINIKDASGKILATYTVCISGDVDGDGSAASAFDFATVNSYNNALKSIGEVYILAGDLAGNDNKIDAFDVSAIMSATNALKSIDYANRVVK